MTGRFFQPEAQARNGDTSWMLQAKFGIFVHALEANERDAMADRLISFGRNVEIVYESRGRLKAERLWR